MNIHTASFAVISYQFALTAELTSRLTAKDYENDMGFDAKLHKPA